MACTRTIVHGTMTMAITTTAAKTNVITNARSAAAIDWDARTAGTRASLPAYDALNVSGAPVPF